MGIDIANIMGLMFVALRINPNKRVTTRAVTLFFTFLSNFMELNSIIQLIQRVLFRLNPLVVIVY